MDKTILVLINGRAGVGKDTFVTYCKTYAKTRSCSVYNFHRSDGPKKVLKLLGWDGTKDLESRGLLKHMVDFMEGKGLLNKALDQVLEHINQEPNQGIVFYHVRDPKVMYALMDGYINKGTIRPISLLVKRDLPQPEEPGEWWDIEDAEYNMTLQLPEDDLERTKEAAIAFVDFLLDSNFKVMKQDKGNE